MSNVPDTPSSQSPGVPENWYLEEWRDLEEMRRRGRARVDQMIAGGAGGALVLSVTFVDQLGVPATEARLYLLAGAWAILLLTLGASLTSSVTQTRAFKVAQRKLHKMRDAGEYCDGWEESGWDRATTWLNNISLVGLWLGIGGLAVYVWLNLGRRFRGQKTGPIPARHQQGSW